MVINNCWRWQAHFDDRDGHFYDGQQGLQHIIMVLQLLALPGQGWGREVAMGPMMVTVECWHMMPISYIIDA